MIFCLGLIADGQAVVSPLGKSCVIAYTSHYSHYKVSVPLSSSAFYGLLLDKIAIPISN